jgi:hypothetical protein
MQRVTALSGILVHKEQKFVEELMMPAVIKM